MKTKLKISIAIIISLMILSCKSQQNSTTKSVVPKIENYTKSELEIKVVPFGYGSEITVGKVLKDGTIHFIKWPDNIDANDYENGFEMQTNIKFTVGMNVCNEKQIIEENNIDNAKVIEVRNLWVYKYGQQVGSLFPATQKEMQDNGGSNRESGLVLGSTFFWIYSEGNSNFKAKCTTDQEWENSYDIKKITTYDIQLKKGWNIVQHTLLEKEDWINDTDKGSLPKTISVKTIASIPSNINWYLKYWANDELLELEHKLFEQTPITKKQYENWLLENLGDLKRTNYEIGKKIERLPTTNNINLLFEKETKKIDITIVDCVGNKDAGNLYTTILDMTSTEWKEETETGYHSVAKLDNIPVLIDYNKDEALTTLTYNTNGRFLIKAEAINIKPEELWNQLKQLEIEKLSN